MVQRHAGFRYNWKGWVETDGNYFFFLAKMRYQNRGNAWNKIANFTQSIFFPIKSACVLKAFEIGDIPDMCVKQGRFIPEFNRGCTSKSGKISRIFRVSNRTISARSSINSLPKWIKLTRMRLWLWRCIKNSAAPIAVPTVQLRISNNFDTCWCQWFTKTG